MKNDINRLPREFVEHPVFADLDEYQCFYRRLAHAVFPFVNPGTVGIGNIDSYVYSSMEGTLESIRRILDRGRLNDAYALLRKYHDSAIINVYSNLYLSAEFSIENLCVKKINDWLQGKEQLPDYRKMNNYVLASDKVAVINDLLRSDDRYKKLRERCNDHTHYNFYHNVLLNDNEINLSYRVKALDLLCQDVRNLFILHVSYLFFLCDHYMMSSDYLDSLEVGWTPEPDSEYWVAPFVQDVFDNILTVRRPDIADAIKNNTSMQL